MKKIFAAMFGVFALATLASAAEWQDEYVRLLKKYAPPLGVTYPLGVYPLGV